MRLPRLLVLAAAVTLAAGGGADAASVPPPVTFAPQVTYPVGTEPGSVAAGDLNGDGYPDLVAASQTDGTVSVLLGSGDGTFAAAGSPLAAGAAPVYVAIGDVNGDGRPDLVVVNHTDSVSVLLGNGDGTFAAPSPITVGFEPYSVALGDLNGDGRPDLAVANGDGSVSVLLGNGDGTFVAAAGSPITVGPSAVSIAIADLNGDGRPDLAVTNDSLSTSIDGTVSVLLGNGDGTFVAAAGSPITVGVGPVSLAVGDLNGDGHPDLAVANWRSDGVSVLLGAGDGTFVEAGGSPIADAGAPYAVAIGDLSGDGRPDLAVADDGNADVSVLVGNGDGTFAPGVAFGGGTSPLSVAIGDFNGDRAPDLALANWGDGTVSVLLNTTSFPGEGKAGVSAQVLPALTVSLDKASLDFGSVLPGASATRSLTATVTSNDGAGYQLAVSRTAFTPKDLPFSVACTACGLVATPVPTSSLLAVAQTSGPSADTGDAWPTTLTLGPIPTSAPAGSYASTLTFTVVGL